MFGQLGCTPDVARLLTMLTTHQHCLPQGAPTSPALANLYLRLSGAASRLLVLVERHDLRMTFFGDDILISGDRTLMGLTAHFAEIVESRGLRLNRNKTLPVAGPNESISPSAS
jgi:RNA-directed DNA polymerase